MRDKFLRVFLLIMIAPLISCTTVAPIESSTLIMGLNVNRTHLLLEKDHLDSGHIIPKGIYRPILSSSSGYIVYEGSTKLHIDDFFGGYDCFGGLVLSQTKPFEDYFAYFDGCGFGRLTKVNLKEKIDMSIVERRGESYIKHREK